MADCLCLACTHFTVGGLAALYQHREPLAYRLASMHNLAVLGTLATSLQREVLYTANTQPNGPESNI